MKKLVLAVTMVLVCFAAMAQEGVPAPPAPAAPAPEGPQSNIFTKFFRGVGNIIMAPIEIPVTIFNVTADCDISIGVSAGTIAGAAAGAERAACGALDIATFLFPPYDRPLVTFELGKSPAAASAISAFPKEF